MVTVYKVSEPGNETTTRLHLPNTEWGNTIRERLQQAGYTVQATDLPRFPDIRDEVELARVNAILEWAAPY